MTNIFQRGSNHQPDDYLIVIVCYDSLFFSIQWDLEPQEMKQTGTFGKRIWNFYQLFKTQFDQKFGMGQHKCGFGYQHVELDDKKNVVHKQSVDSRKQQTWISLAACGIQAGKELALATKSFFPGCTNCDW